MSSFLFTGRALFDYWSVESTELSLTVGCLVRVQEVNASGWSLARLCGTEDVGWIPTEYIEKVDSDGARIDGIDAAIVVARPQALSDCQAVEVTLATSHSHSSLAANASVSTSQMQPIQSSKPREDDKDVTAVRFTPSNTVVDGPPLPPKPQNYLLPTSASQPSAATSPPAASCPQSEIAAAAALLPVPLPVSVTPLPGPKVCSHCHESIKSAFVMAKDQLFHPNHFLCSTCDTPLGGKPYLERDGQFYCEDDFYAKYNPQCWQCKETIRGPYVSALGHAYHVHHFLCQHCEQPFTNGEFRSHDGKAYCEDHYTELFAPRCTKCHERITGAVFEALGHKYHLECFTCSHSSQHRIGETEMFHCHERQIYCQQHFESMFLHQCVECSASIKGPFIKIAENYYHDTCWLCSVCRAVLRPESCQQSSGQFYCRPCFEREKQATQAPYMAIKPATTASTAANPTPAGTVTSTTAASSSTEPQQPSSKRASLTNAFQSLINSQNQSPSKPQSKASSVQSSPVLSAVTRATQSAAIAPFDDSPSKAVEYSDPASSPAIAYEVLKDPAARPSEVDPRRKEQYLADDAFAAVFGVDRAKFAAMAEWKRNEHKKRVGLF